MYESDNILTELIAARSLILDKNNWVKGSMAVTLKDVACHPLDPLAAKWCALGAILKVADEESFATSYIGLKRRLEESCGFKKLSFVNDNFGHQAVIDVFDRLILLEFNS